MDISLKRDYNNNLQLNRHEVFVILNNIRYNSMREAPDEVDRDIIEVMRALYTVFRKEDDKLNDLIKVFNKYADVKCTYKHNYQLDKDYVSGYNVKFEKSDECIEKILDIIEDKNQYNVSSLIKYKVQPYEQDM